MNPDLMKLFMDRYQSSDANAKSFSDRLRERRQFVQSTGDQGVNAGLNVVNNGGANGIRIPSGDAVGGAMDYYTNESNRNQDLQGQSDSYNKDASSALEAILGLITASQSAAAAQANSDRDYNLKKEEQSRKNYETGFDASTPGLTAQVNGKEAIAKVTKDGGQDLLSGDQKTQEKIAQDIIKAGGVAKYRGQIKLTPDKQRLVDDIDKLLSEDTKPVTGSIRQGNGKLGGILDTLTGSNYTGLSATADRVRSQLQLINAQIANKGQGSVSEYERSLFGKASSNLNKADLNDKEFKAELQRLRNGLTGTPNTPTGDKKQKVGGYVIEEVK